MISPGYDAIIAIMSCRIAVRVIALLRWSGWADPAVVVVDCALRHAIALVGGHHGASLLGITIKIKSYQNINLFDGTERFYNHINYGITLVSSR